MVKLITLLILLLCTCSSVYAEIADPFDTNATESQATDQEENLDKLKSPDQLIAEAEYLLQDERPLDARTKLLRALAIDPKSFKAHMLLADYYMVTVGHFRLSLKHVKQAQNLFREQKGAPPYQNKEDQLAHSQLLYLLSQARLNLDDYKGSLEVLDEFQSNGYVAAWYPGTRAWVLMKLGRVDEAIRAARVGMVTGAEPGRTLNMLGILLSMHGEREESVRIFKEALAYELSQGTLGQPATPLNNTGEVFKEIFQEDSAESSWLKATSMPDGCEHVLPSLNLALLYLDQLNLTGAKRAIDNFETCVAQYPLRNGEEHKALVKLARGRISLLSGHPQEAIEQLSESLENQQWFGKIGTSEGDLKVGALVSLAQAYQASANHFAMTVPASFLDRLYLFQQNLSQSILSWWYFRKARHLLASDLNDFEDISIRNTDSLLEYPTLGDAAAGFSIGALSRKVSEEKNHDPRKTASVYYSAYLAQSLLENGRVTEGLKRVEETIAQLRAKYDDLLLIHLMGISLRYLPESSPTYISYSERIFSLSHSALRRYGGKLSVSLNTTNSEIISALSKAGFSIQNAPDRLFTIEAATDGSDYSLSFIGPQFLGGKIKVHGEHLNEVVNRLADTLFSEDVL